MGTFDEFINSFVCEETKIDGKRSGFKIMYNGPNPDKLDLFASYFVNGHSIDNVTCTYKQTVTDFKV